MKDGRFERILELILEWSDGTANSAFADALRPVYEYWWEMPPGAKSAQLQSVADGAHRRVFLEGLERVEAAVRDCTLPEIFLDDVARLRELISEV